MYHVVVLIKVADNNNKKKKDTEIFLMSTVYKFPSEEHIISSLQHTQQFFFLHPLLVMDISLRSIRLGNNFGQASHLIAQLIIIIGILLELVYEE